MNVGTNVNPVNPRLAKAWQIRAEAKNDPLIFDDVRPDLCAELAEIILSMSRSPSTPSLNKSGWKSNERFLTLGNPPVVELAAALADLLGAPSVGWAMVNRNGSSHPRHQHRIAVLSWVYFVEVGDPLVPTIFETTEGGVRGELDVEPQVGRFIVFPGEMWHRVPAYPGQMPRITIAGDVRR